MAGLGLGFRVHLNPKLVAAEGRVAVGSCGARGRGERQGMLVDVS